VKVPENATSIPSSPLGRVLHTRSPNPPEAVSPSPEGVTSPYTQDAPSRAQALDRNVLSAVMKQTDAGNSKVAVRPQKRPRRSRGRGRGKDAANAPAPEETENIPPATRENKPTHQRPARRPGRTRNGSGPAVTRGRSENRATVDSERIAGTRLVTEDAGGGMSTSRSANAGRRRGNGRRASTGFRSNSKAPGHLSSGARADADVPGTLAVPEPIQDVVSATEENGETPEATKDNPAKTNDEDHGKDTKDRVVPVEIAPPANDIPAAPEEKAEPEVDVSTVPPLPSSTRRRAKEYFQRRTRERSGSVDAETTGPSGGATVAEQVIPNPGFRTKDKAGDRKRPASWSVPVSHKNHDQFAFDPEASPFTPNATSSPRQASLSSIGVQSFSSPSPLPPHGNRKVAPLTLVRNSGKSDTLETISSSSQPIPMTPHGGQEDAYYAGRNLAQAHLQAEQQLALMRLQAYYSWLAGNIPPSVGVIRAREHMDLSGGGGGLSGGVALGRQGGQGRGRGKAQSRNASGAYAHPKEHVVYSPREHEQAQQLAPGVISQRDDGEIGQPNAQKDEADQPLEAAAQGRVQKWDGSWGLREGPGIEVGWNWGGNGVGNAREVGRTEVNTVQYAE
jgi:hypothetical protein